MLKVRTVFGTMDIGRRSNLEEDKLILNLFSKYGYTEIDSALNYGDGKTEAYLGDLKELVDPNFSYASKANPLNGKGLGAASIRNQLDASLNAMKRDKIDIFYLHAPDHNTPLTETLAAVDALHMEGKFVEFGLSNYSAWLVAEVVNLCKQNGFVKPTVYQGMYSALIPCLRYYGMRFYAYSPLAGGLLTGKHKFEDRDKSETGRFFGSSRVPGLYRERYWKQEYFNAVEDIRESLSDIFGQGEVSVADAAYRWLYHHSLLNGEFGDGVIVGAATVEQLDQNLAYTMKGPLHENVVKVINEIYGKISHVCHAYAR